MVENAEHVIMQCTMHKNYCANRTRDDMSFSVSMGKILAGYYFKEMRGVWESAWISSYDIIRI